MSEHWEPEPQTLDEQLRVLIRDVREIKVQTTATNGRVMELERWRLSIEEAKRISDAFKQGASSALLTRKQATVALGVATTLCTVATAITGLIVRFIG